MGAQSRIQRTALALTSVVIVFAGLSLRARLDPGGEVTNANETAARGQVTPIVTSVRFKGKELTVIGLNFDNGAIIWVDGSAQKTENDPDGAASVLIAKKARKWIARETIATMWVQNPDGLVSKELSFYTGCNSE